MDVGFALFHELKDGGVVHLSETAAYGSKLPIFGNKILQVYHGYIRSQQINGFVHNCYLILVITVIQQIHRIQNDLDRKSVV